MFVRRVALCCVLAAAVPAVTLADSRITFKATEGGGSMLQSLLVGQGKLRIDADATTSVIVDPKTETVIVLMHTQKQFMRLSRAQVEQLSGLLDTVMKQMQATLASMSPEQRAKAEAAMGGMAGGAGKVATANTGRTAQVAGHTCRVFHTTMAGKPIAEVCYGDLAAIQMPAADRATVQAAMKMGKDMFDRLASGPMAQFAKAAPFATDGVPLRTTEFAADGSRRTSEFAGVTTGPIPAESFAVPAGYKEQQLPMMGGRGGR
jgi:hypothetical protein